MQILKFGLGFFVVGSILFGIALGGWYLKRQVNYNLLYKSMVQQTIKDMVKPEALK